MTTDRFTKTVSRRTALVSVGLLLGSAIVAGTEAAEMSVTEKTNVKLVNDFLKGWAARDATGVKLAEFVSDDASC